MAKWNCLQCSGEFTRETLDPKKARFCSLECYWKWRSAHVDEYHHFSKGSTPWNKGVMGVHHSPATEFKPGHDSGRTVSVGTIRVRKTKGCVPRAFVKVAEPNIWLLNAISVWMKHRGEVLPGMLIHHINGNALDDRPENLTMIDRAEHINVHRSQLLRAKLRKHQANLKQNAVAQPPV